MMLAPPGTMSRLAVSLEGFYPLADMLGEMFDMNPFRYQKTWSFYKLAMEAEKGVIVELGAYQGCGAIALCKGVEKANRATPVFTVDSYQNVTGWAGEPYSHENYDIFKTNVNKAKVRPNLLHMSFLEASKGWVYPVSLLIWDGGVTNVSDDIKPWIKHVIVRGKIVLRDTLNYSLHCDMAMAELTAFGKFEKCDPMPGGVNVLQRIRR